MGRVFLTSEQLTEMTGYRSSKGRRKWLAENGYKFDVRSDGRPNVFIQQVQERQCEKVDRAHGPDLAWMDEAS